MVSFHVSSGLRYAGLGRESPGISTGTYTSRLVDGYIVCDLSTGRWIYRL